MRGRSRKMAADIERSIRKGNTIGGDKMLNKKYLTIIVLIVVAAGLFIVKDKLVRQPLLSVRQAVNIFAKEDIHLTKTSDPNAEEINGVKPTTFFINDTENKLNIYRYNSITERKNAYEIWNNSNENKISYSEPKTNAKNIMFVIIPVDEKQITSKDCELVGKVVRTVFEKVNDTQEIVFTGVGENWESQTIVKYYEYFYKEEDGTLNCDNYHIRSSSLKYLGKDIESVGEISYELQHSSGGGSGSGLIKV